MNVNEQTVLMLGVLLVGVPAVLSLGSLIYDSILSKREQAKQIEQCCREWCDEMCGCQGCVERECECECCECSCKAHCECGCECECHDEAECTCKREEECGCCGKPLEECECNCSCHKH